jgi:hypothetical protein
MLGMSRTVRGDRLTGHELVVLREREGRLVYQAHPSGQPAAEFFLKTFSDSMVVFEDPQHDFPQRVGYRRPVGDSLLAWIEGTNISNRIGFRYRRVLPRTWEPSRSRHPALPSPRRGRSVPIVQAQTPRLRRLNPSPSARPISSKAAAGAIPWRSGGRSSGTGIACTPLPCGS